MDRLGLWLGTNKAAFAFPSDRCCEPNNSSSRVSLLEQQLNRHNILTGTNMWMVMIAQHSISSGVVETYTLISIYCVYDTPS